jgi:hypothetical protein
VNHETWPEKPSPSGTFVGDQRGTSEIGMRFLSMHTNPSPRVLDRKPGIYIVEINNREIVALEATCLAEARHLITERWFRIRLTEHTTKGIPVWDGKAQLQVRPVTEAEAETLSTAQSSQTTHGDFTLTFLVDLDGSGTVGGPVEPGAFPPQRD